MKTKLMCGAISVILIFLLLHINTNPMTRGNVFDIPNWPEEKLRILFIHHSCGALLWNSYGNLANELDSLNIEPHDATYGDEIGDDTDVCHWYPKFRDYLNEVLSFNHSVDVYYTVESGVVNDIIMFKSCYPASAIEGWGTEPGDPESCIQTIANYQAAYNALIPIFSANPDTLFIPVTAPPLNRYGGWTPENGQNASYFNTWLMNDWASDSTNIAIFDWFHFLANPTDFAARDDYVDGSDSHPNRKACEDTVVVFLDWIDDVILRWQTGASTTTPATTDSPTETPTTAIPAIPGFPILAIIPAILIIIFMSVTYRRNRKTNVIKTQQNC